MASNFPSFDELPRVDGMPQGCAWGVFDKDKNKDVHGTLNFLTTDIVAAACKEAKDGVSISLNWPLNALSLPTSDRIETVHKATALENDCYLTKKVFVDELHFDTQCTSQWDSLCHWCDSNGLAYNGIPVSKEGLTAASKTENNPLPTLDHWHARGGLVARGVLIDYKAWYEAQAAKEGKTGDAAIFPAWNGHRITIEEIETIAAYQNIAFRPGDVLLVRTGATEFLGNLSEVDTTKIKQWIVVGVHGSVETARWIWDKKFAAVACDTLAFEALPPMSESGEEMKLGNLVLHHWLLVMFGMSIGELWDLKKLGEHCQKTGRYSFLLTSVPLSHPGLVGSPANALAIF